MHTVASENNLASEYITDCEFADISARASRIVITFILKTVYLYDKNIPEMFHLILKIKSPDTTLPTSELGHPERYTNVYYLMSKASIASCSSS